MSVSVVLPVYNGAGSVGRALQSVYAQVRPPDEVIVVDDGSTDETLDVVGKFADRAVQRIVTKPNGGEASARNAGVREATGDFVAFLDHDDTWHPEKLARQLDAFDPRWGLSFTAHVRRTPSAAVVECRDEWDPDPSAVLTLLKRSCAVGPTSTVIVRRQVLGDVGPFEQVRPFGDDWLMWLRIAAGGHSMGYLPEPLAEYTWHGGNLSADEHGYYDAACEIFDRVGDRKLRARWRLLSAIDAHEMGERRRSRRRIIEASRIHPRSIRPGWMRFLM